jgi:hypothetical protein
MMALMDGPMEFHDCDDVTLFLDGGSDAGFVQVIRDKVDDADRLKGMLADTTMLHEMRPEIIGGTLAMNPTARLPRPSPSPTSRAPEPGETLEPPLEVRAELEYAMQGARFYDLHHPWFESAG